MNTHFTLPGVLNVIEDYIEVGASNRPGLPLVPRYITIHNTANTDLGADAKMHARYLKGEDARKRKVSWHFTVDDKVCVQSLPIDEQGWHAGKLPSDKTSLGNKSSIGIEICENSDIDQADANHNAAVLTGKLLLQLNLEISNVLPHRHWSGKWCPHLLLDEQGSIGVFIELVKTELDRHVAKGSLIALNDGNQCTIAKFPPAWLDKNM